MLVEDEKGSATLRLAIQRESVATKQGLLQRLFAFWFDAFVYNQIWEDPRVDLEALQIGENSRILTISSGGCNALNYVLANPRSITAVDLNRHHVYLLNLKLAALKHLPDYDAFFAFFGEGKKSNAVELFSTYIARHLDAGTREYWESNAMSGRLNGNGRISLFEHGGLYDNSRNGRFLKFFHKFAGLIGCDPPKVLTARSVPEQIDIYSQHIDPFFENFLFKLIGKLPVTMFGLGIPPQQYEELKKELNGGTIIDIYRDRVRRLACDFPVNENYFAWQAFARKYDVENRLAVPEYLKAENYERLKHAAEAIRTRIGSVTEEILRNPPGTFNRFVFLDAQDWMDVNAIVDLWAAIEARAELGSRIIFRTAGSRSPVEPVLPEKLRAKFIYEKDLSLELFEKDRSSIYGGFHVYRLEFGP
jgi:S-adenosylmethionine-diacylglycerol 3-amino-3-carboxypropyl transferase